MRNFQKKRGWRNILHSRPVLALLCILALFFTFGVFRFMGKMQITGENRRIAEEKVAALARQKAELSAGISKLKTDRGVEESIREKFGLAKEGEGLIVIVKDKNKPIPEAVPRKGFFSFFTRWFK